MNIRLDVFVRINPLHARLALGVLHLSGCVVTSFILFRQRLHSKLLIMPSSQLLLHKSITTLHLHSTEENILSRKFILNFTSNCINYMNLIKALSWFSDYLFIYICVILPACRVRDCFWIFRFHSKEIWFIENSVYHKKRGKKPGQKQTNEQAKTKNQK